MMQTKIKTQLKKLLVPVLREIFYKRMEEKPVASANKTATTAGYAN